MRIALPLMFLLAACSQSDGDADSGNAAANAAAAEKPAEPAQAEAIPPMTGQWRVTAIRGNPLIQAYAMNAEVSGDRFVLQSDCVRLGWDFTQDRNIVAFKDAAVEGCARGLNSDEEQAKKAIGNATIAMFSNEGQEAQLSGSGGSLTMVRR